MIRLLICARDMGGAGAGQWRKGEVVGAMPGDHQWGNMEGPPDFVRVDVTDGELADVAALNAQWTQDLDWDVVQSNQAQDRHRLLIWATNRRARDGLGDPGVTQLQEFLESWGGTNIAAGSREDGSQGVRADMAVFAAATSPGFWERNVGVGEFTELDYVQAGGVHDIRLIYPPQVAHGRAVTEVRTKAVVLQEAAAERRIDFRVTRTDVFAVFKAQLRDLVSEMMKRRRWYVGPEAVDQALGLGGELTRTKAQVQAAIRDAMSD